MFWILADKVLLSCYLLFFLVRQTSQILSCIFEGFDRCWTKPFDYVWLDWSVGADESESGVTFVFIFRQQYDNFVIDHCFVLELQKHWVLVQYLRTGADIHAAFIHVVACGVFIWVTANTTHMSSNSIDIWLTRLIWNAKLAFILFSSRSIVVQQFNNCSWLN